MIESPDPNYRRPFPGAIVEAGMLPHPISIYRRIRNVDRRDLGSDAVKPAPTQSGGMAAALHVRRWILSLLQTPDVFTGWLLPATFAGLKAIRREKISHIVSSGPYWTNHLVGLLLAKITGLRWTAHYRDPWTQVPQEKPVSALSLKLERWLERCVIKRADRVVCVTETHTNALRQLFKRQPSEKFVTIPNGYDEGEWEDIDCEPRDDEKFRITYPGTLRMGTRSPRPLFAALRQLIDEGSVDAARLQVDLFGSCEIADGMRVTDMAAQYGLSDCVSVGPPVSRPETLRRMVASNLLLLLAEGWDLQIPGKTYEYLRAGRPILALTSNGALSNLLRDVDIARVAAPSDHAAITESIRSIYSAWRNGEKESRVTSSAVRLFDRRHLAGRFASLFDAGTSRERAV